MPRGVLRKYNNFDLSICVSHGHISTQLNSSPPDAVRKCFLRTGRRSAGLGYNDGCFFVKLIFVKFPGLINVSVAGAKRVTIYVITTLSRRRVVHNICT